MGTLSRPLYFDNQHFARAATASFGKNDIARIKIMFFFSMVHSRKVKITNEFVSGDLENKDINVKSVTA